jgi:uncharacterized membrane protein YcaP (DUF421 family)
MYIIFTYSARIFIVYFFTFLATRIMTKKAIAEMTAYEIAGLMVISNVAAEPLVDKVVIKSVYGVGMLVILMTITGRLALINKLTPIFEHTATIVIENGQINIKALKRLHLTLNQLEGLLRQQGYDKVSDIQTAVFEAQGNLSVFPKAVNMPVTLKDLNIPASDKQITLPLILDGNIISSNLEHISKNEFWLLSELKKQGIQNYKKQVALAELDPSWNIVVIKK